MSFPGSTASGGSCASLQVSHGRGGYSAGGVEDWGLKDMKRQRPPLLAAETMQFGRWKKIPIATITPTRGRIGQNSMEICCSSYASCLLSAFFNSG
jgi:hypothetical protein